MRGQVPVRKLGNPLAELSGVRGGGTVLVPQELEDTFAGQRLAARQPGTDLLGVDARERALDEPP